MTLEWKWQNFNHLSVDELYAIMTLRSEVFVVEQNCVYQDLDGLDQKSWHLSGWNQETLVAYLRVTPVNTKFAELSFGRVVTSPSTRGRGFGKILTQKALDCIETHLGHQPIRISAQAHLENFYHEFGFTKDSDPYLEDGIPHIEMLSR